MKGKACNTSCSLCESRGSSCFSSMETSLLEELSEEKTGTTFEKNRVLFNEGGRPLGVFCIKKGKIKVYKRGISGKEQIVQIAKEGDLLGYRALIAEEAYPVTAETLEECQICFVTKQDFVDLLSKSRELNNTLLKQACNELGLYTEMVTNQAQMSVRERCALMLYKVYEIYGGNGSNNIEINLTREDLANFSGTATETFIRLLHEFKDEGIIESSGRKLTILKPAKLRSIGHIYG